MSNYDDAVKKAIKRACGYTREAGSNWQEKLDIYNFNGVKIDPKAKTNLDLIEAIQAKTCTTPTESLDEMRKLREEAISVFVYAYANYACMLIFRSGTLNNNLPCIETNKDEIILKITTKVLEKLTLHIDRHGYDSSGNLRALIKIITNQQLASYLGKHIKNSIEFTSLDIEENKPLSSDPATEKDAFEKMFSIYAIKRSCAYLNRKNPVQMSFIFAKLGINGPKKTYKELAEENEDYSYDQIRKMVKNGLNELGILYKKIVE